MESLAATRQKTGLVLDPRTKLLVLITVTTLMFSTSNQGWMNLVKPVLSLIPFALLFSARRVGAAAKYLVLYAVCFGAERLAMNVLSGMPSFLLMAVASIMTRFAPGIMTAAYLAASTSVSEFIAAMERMHMSEKITIPLSVIFRFLPTISEEAQSINDAMRMRGIRLGKCGPTEWVEYRIVPLMISVVKIGDELSAAALTRGLGAPGKRTNVCEIGFHAQDFVLFAVCGVCFALFFVELL